MKKFALAVLVSVLAIVIGIGFSTMAVADNERFEAVSLDVGQSPPPGKITVRTMISTIEGFNICYWGKPGLKIEKGVAIQRWAHPNGEIVVYNLFLPDKKMAEEVIGMPKLPGVLRGMKRQLDDKSISLKDASIGRQVWVNLDVKTLMVRLDP